MAFGAAYHSQTLFLLGRTSPAGSHGHGTDLASAWPWTNLSRHSSAMGTFSARNCGHLGHEPPLPALGQALVNDQLRQLIHSTQVVQPSPFYITFRNCRGKVMVSPNIFKSVMLKAPFSNSVYPVF